jgi:hypothetical protein
VKVELKRCQWDDGSPLGPHGYPHDARRAFVERSESGSTYVRIFAGDAGQGPYGRLALAAFIDDLEQAHAFVENLRAAGVEVEVSE